MSHAIVIELEVPETLRGLRLPAGVDRRLQALLDRQDAHRGLTEEERTEAEGLADVAELLTLLRLRARRLTADSAVSPLGPRGVPLGGSTSSLVEPRRTQPSARPAG